MPPSRLPGAMNSGCGHGVPAAAVIFLAFCAVLAGCETAPAPVSERRVEEYRKPPPAPPLKPAASEPSAAGAAAPATSAAKSSAPKVAPAPDSSGTTTSAPATSTAKSAAAPKSVTPKPVPTPETATTTTPSTPAASTSKPAASKTVPGEEVEGDSRPEFYTVKRGDTVYGIALDAGLDYKELAAWNQLDDANVIRVGQQLRLHPPAGWKPDPADAEGTVVRPAASTPQVESLPLEPSPQVKSSPKGIKAPYSEQAFAQLTRDPGKVPVADGKPPAEPKPDARPAPPTDLPTATSATPAAAQSKVATAPAASTKALEPAPGVQLQDSAGWVWPTTGKLLHPFNEGNNPKGVAIGGNLGQPIVASAAGKVVYSGMGLRGYGKLIIIKHDNTYLSVYAHNRELLVREGERVSKGQRIAEMGNLDSERVGLHFEIRRQGKPVDPLEYLPPEGSS
jgi:lipoprotein NlpD